MKVVRAALAAAFLMLGAATAFAVQPDEMLSDPALEARARAISAELRCMVCQNQSIDDSDAELARDLRVLVRERLSAGDSDRQVLDFVVARYGEFVLLRPPLNARNAALWAAPVLILLIGGLFVALRGRGNRGKTGNPLSEAEKRELRNILGD